MADTSRLPRVSGGKDGHERAVEIFDVLPEWLFGAPLIDLLRVVGEEPPTDGHVPPSTAGAQWQHLDESLRGWATAGLHDEHPAVAGLSPDQVATLRRTLLLERAAARHFDFRARTGGPSRERFEIGVADFDEAARAAVHDRARHLGLVESGSTRHHTYDHTLVLGGGYRSPLLRNQLTAQLLAGGLELGELSLLGSPRFLLVPADDSGAEPESAVTDQYAPGAADEFDLMVAAARVALQAQPGPVIFLCGCDSPAQACPQWTFRDSEAAARTPAAFTHERRVDLVVDGRHLGAALSASTGRPPERPDTADTYRLWARLNRPQPGARVLVVTTQIFVPFQTFDGLRLLYLPYGVDLDCVGLGAEWADRPETPEHLLQETLSGIRSARRLLAAAAAVLARR